MKDRLISVLLGVLFYGGMAFLWACLAFGWFRPAPSTPLPHNPLAAACAEAGFCPDPALARDDAWQRQWGQERRYR